MTTNSSNSILTRRPNEGAEDFLWRLGSLKEAGVLPLTWPQIAVVLNTQVPNLAHPLSESTWRKKYQQMAGENPAATMNEIEDIQHTYDLDSTVNKDYDVDNPDVVSSDPDEEFNADKMIVRLRDERYALNRITRSEARRDALLDLFKSEISRYPASKIPAAGVSDSDTETAVYALLSDVHYGIAFSTVAGVYNSNIAKARVMRYADRIVEIGKNNNANTCYVSLLGDMISGTIHTPIRIENRENAVQQVVGVSELVADFLYVLSQNFSVVNVNSVSGNHSRLDAIAENSLRAEKLDALVLWYCKAKLENVGNVNFFENSIDDTVSSFNIFGKNYIGVHGDYDKNVAESANRIERLIGTPVDYMISGHMHTPNMHLLDRGYIRNGSVCGSGDDYTMRNRLFGNPYQICMTVNKDGIQSLWPVKLSLID